MSDPTITLHLELFSHVQVYCTEDYNRKRAPKCSFCKKPIVPKEGQKSAPRLRALGRDYHPQCFQCEVGNTKDRVL